MPAAQVLEIGLALTEALGHLHRRGLVHRDVKPSNVIFVNGWPKLADIGLVTDASDACSIVGTEGYLPPEGPGTPQADLFALGKLLFEAATGQDRRQFPQLPSDLHSWPNAKLVFELSEILLRACALSPRQRYRSAEEMRADLALLHSGESVRSRYRLERRLRIPTRIGAETVTAMVLGAIPYYVAIRGAHLARVAANEKGRQAERADREAARAGLAEADAREKLRGSYLDQAQARRWSGHVGRRNSPFHRVARRSHRLPGAVRCSNRKDLDPGRSCRYAY